MNRTAACILLSTSAVLLTSCGGGSSMPSGNVDIYVAGLTLTTNNGDVIHAAYWKNGQFISLGDSGGSLAEAIAVVGGTVHTVGSQFDSSGYQATDWINGTPNLLTDSGLQTEAYDVATDGTDVYIAGASYKAYQVQQAAVYWKNGSVVHLPSTSIGPASANVAISGGHVYVSGHEISNNGVDTAVYWLDGKETILPSNGLSAVARGIAVDGSDFYVVGTVCLSSDPTCNSDPSSNSTAVYWKNGEQVVLSGGTSASGIALSNGHIYVCGLNGGSGVFWIDGVATAYSGESLNVTQIVAVGNNFYTAGFTDGTGGYSQGGYWINNSFTAVNATGSQTSALGIAVVLPSSMNQQ